MGNELAQSLDPQGRGGWLSRTGLGLLVRDAVPRSKLRLPGRTGYYLQLLAGAGWTSLPALPLIRQPTLILAGNDDPVLPLVDAQIMHSLLPNGSLLIFDDGHLRLLTAADEPRSSRAS